MSFEALPRDRSLADPLPSDPFGIFERWIEEASGTEAHPNPTAMALACVDLEGRPSSRMVLCRGIDAGRGAIVFYTNLESRKGRELRARPLAAATFHWDGMQRQVRLEGPVARVSDAFADAYFAGRPRDAQIAAWSSAQSEPLASREALLEQLRATEARFGGADGETVPRPPFWGGFALTAQCVELWVGSVGRAHDRVLWKREGAGWRSTRLQP